MVDRFDHSERWLARARERIRAPSRDRIGSIRGNGIVLSEKECTVSDCPNVVSAKGLCNKHYLRQRNNGHPLATNYGKPQEGVKPRACEVCGKVYQPYRNTVGTWCSDPCKYRHPRYIERKAAARRVDTAADPEHQRELNLRRNLLKYGLTVRQYRAMVAEQNNRCKVCGAEPDPDGIKASARLHVDHDHTTGDIRSLLCTRCNQGVGYFRDDPELLEAMAAYIRSHRMSRLSPVEGGRHGG